LHLIFKGLDYHGNGHLTRQDIEYVKVIAPLFQPMARLAPSISELSAWVHNDLGSIQALLDGLGLREGHSEQALSPNELAMRLTELGYKGSVQEVTRSIARSNGGGPGYGIYAEDLVKLIIGQKPNASHQQGYKTKVADRLDGGVKQQRGMKKQQQNAPMPPWDSAIATTSTTKQKAIGNKAAGMSGEQGLRSMPTRIKNGGDPEWNTQSRSTANLLTEANIVKAKVDHVRIRPGELQD
jgi:hypothetical protein